MYFRWVGPGELSARARVRHQRWSFSAWRRSCSSAAGRTRFPKGVEGALLLTLMPLLSPQGWDYVFLIATPAIVFLANYQDRLPRPLRVLTIAAVATIGFSLFDLMGRAAYHAFMRLSFISLCYFVVIAALATLRLRKIA